MTADASDVCSVLRSCLKITHKRGIYMSLCIRSRWCAFDLKARKD